MKRLLVFAFFACLCACGLHAQAVDTTVCAVLKNPQSFNGKIVRIKGTVVAGFDDFIVRDSGPCGYQIDSIWLSYPEGAKGKAGPAAIVQVQPAHNFAGTYTPPTRTPVTFEKSKDFKQFDNLLAQPHTKGGGVCLGCPRYTVSATLVGRLDGVASAALTRDKAGKIVGFGGFGNMNAYPARLVLQSVSDVTSKEIDYSKTDEVTKDAQQPFGGNGGGMLEPLDVAKKAADRLGSSPVGVQAEKDVDVFGKPGDHTGATISHGQTNEASAKDEELGAKDSPDGILFNCILNLNRLDSTAQPMAIMHMGQHISDMRSPMPGNEDAPLYVLEYNAWSMTAAEAAIGGQKFLTLPGGYLLWNATWTPEERTDKMDDAMKGFLANQAALSR